jgi:hypothetical protein
MICNYQATVSVYCVTLIDMMGSFIADLQFIIGVSLQPSSAVYVRTYMQLANTEK